MKSQEVMPLVGRLVGAASIAAILLIGVDSGSALAQTKWVDGLLTDEAGTPLYISKREAPGTSECYGQCLNFYVPYKAAPDAQPNGDHSLIKRNDGSQQWAYKGKALYRWWNEKNPKAADGHVMNWYLIRQ